MSKHGRENSDSSAPVGGVILAGGLARRMGGGDKALVPLGGRPMLAHILARLDPQVRACIINANGDPARFSRYDVPVVADPIAGFAGPLAGILAGLMWAQRVRPDLTHMISVAGDTPFFPTDLVARLSRRRTVAPDEVVLAASGGRVQPVFGLWPVSLAADLGAFLNEGTDRKILTFVARHAMRAEPFSPIAGCGDSVDPFFNINSPDDLESAENLAAALAETDAA